MRKTTAYILAIIAILVISFFATAGLFALCCWAFEWQFSWKLSVGVWAALFLISTAVKSNARGGK